MTTFASIGTGIQQLGLAIWNDITPEALFLEVMINLFREISEFKSLLDFSFAVVSGPDDSKVLWDSISRSFADTYKALKRFGMYLDPFSADGSINMIKNIVKMKNLLEFLPTETSTKQRFFRNPVNEEVNMLMRRVKELIRMRKNLLNIVFAFQSIKSSQSSFKRKTIKVEIIGCLFFDC